MNDIFLKILNMSITAGWIVLAVIFLRLLLKRAPKWIVCLLWGIVGLRLVMPFSLESIFSLIPSTETISVSSTQDRPYIETGIYAVNYRANTYFDNHYAQEGSVSADGFSNILTILSIVWILGATAMLLYGAVSYWRLRRKVAASLLFRDNIYYCDDIGSPFILGIGKPRIYLPSGMSEDQMAYVIKHENAHLKRRDHLWKPLGFALLSVYWFHPAMWAAYLLFCRDMEFACDEKAIRDMDNPSRKGYSEALVACSLSRRMMLAYPLSFGEVGVKDRIKSVLHYKRPALWIMIAGIVACAAAAVCFLTSPKGTALEGIDPDITINAICIGTEDQAYEITSEDTFDKILDFISSIRVSSSPISGDRSEDRDAVHSITFCIHGNWISYFFNDNCTEVWIDDGVKASLTRTVKNPEVVLDFFENQAEYYADGIIELLERYGFYDSPDRIVPAIDLIKNDSSFTFRYSFFSNYIPEGTYELTDTTLTLRTDDGKYTYVFHVKDDGFVFDASASSEIPEYHYSGDSDETESPVPDGALFIPFHY